MPDSPRILLIDDEPAVHRAVEFSLRGVAEVTSCLSVEEAMEEVGVRQFDAALVDVDLGEGLSGTQLVSRIGECDPDLAAIIFTAHTDYKTAVDSLGAHSYDFLPKTLRDDPEFRLKIDRAVARTREQRIKSRNVMDASKLRSALADTFINNELEVTNGDIQRGLLSESLKSFSALLGRVELMDLQLKEWAKTASGAGGIIRLSEETMAELQEYVGKMRDYFSEPERAASSVNEVLAQAVRIVQSDLTEHGRHQRIECSELRPDQSFIGDGRALLRAVVILTRLLAKTAGPEAVVLVKPSLVINPWIELSALKSRPHARILRTPNFHKEDKTAIAIEIGGPSGGMDADKVSTLFSPTDVALSAASPWSAVAMLAKLNGALIVEAKGPTLRYRIMIRV